MSSQSSFSEHRSAERRDCWNNRHKDKTPDEKQIEKPQNTVFEY
jgi:hypothetical protein